MNQRILLTVGSTAIAVVLGSLVVNSVYAADAPQAAAVAAMTAADHGKAAADYEQEAAAARAKVVIHKEMADTYRRAPTGRAREVESHYRTVARHCDALVKSYSEAATQAEQLAKQHRALAAMAK